MAALSPYGKAAGVNHAGAKVVGEVALVDHACFRRYAHRSRVPVHNKTDQTLQAQVLLSVSTDRQSGLGREPLAPSRLVDEERQFYLALSVDRPGQQPASANELAGTSLHGCPQPQFGAAWMPKPMPFEFIFRLGKRARAFGKVASNLRIAVEPEERLDVFRLEVAECQSGRLEDDHRGLFAA